MSTEEGGMDPETRKQIITLIGELVSLGLLIVATDPDAGRTVSMWWWRGLGERAWHLSRWADKVSLGAYQRYYREAGQ